MYTILVDGNYLLYPSIRNLSLTEAKLSLEVNKAGELEFVFYPSHPLYGNLVKLKSIVEVYQGATLLFRGRFLNETLNFDKSKSVLCEGELAYLNDSVMRAYNFGGSITEYLQLLIDSHNNQVDTFKQFTLGTITVTDPNNYINRSSIEYVNTWEELSNKLIENLGGYLVIRRVGNINYLDYLVDSPYMSGQKIELGKNLLNLIQETRSDDIITALIPLGARIEDEEGNETDERITIESVNGGVDYVYNGQAVSKYGWIFATQIWDNVTLPENLLSRANQSLEARINLGVSVELNAVDLSMIEDVDEVRLFEYVQVISKEHEIDSMALITKQSLDLLSPQNNTLTFGFDFQSFTDKQHQSDNVLKQIRSDYVTNTKVYGITETVNQQMSEIIQESDRISLEVQSVKSSTYTKAEVDGHIHTVNESTALLDLQIGRISAEVAQLAGMNIVSNIIGEYGTTDWSFISTPPSANPGFAARSLNDHPVPAISVNGPIMYPVEGLATGSKKGFRIWHNGTVLSNVQHATGGGRYSLYTRTQGQGIVRFYVREFATLSPVDHAGYSTRTLMATSIASTGFRTLEGTVELQESTQSVCLEIVSEVNVSTGQYLIFSDSSFNQGNPRPYGESLTDIKSEVQYLNARVTLSEDKVDIFTTRVDNMDGQVTSAIGQLTVQSDKIDLLVQDNQSNQSSITVLNNQISAHTASLLLKADKTEIIGVVKFSDLSESGGTTINGANISTGTITSAKLSSSAVTADKISSGAITSAKLASNAVTADKIISGAITAEKIAANAITAAKINVTNLASIASNLGAITAGSINIGSGNFTVNTAGEVVAKSIVTTGTHNGRLNGTSGYLTGASTVGASTGNFGGGYHNDSSFSRGSFGGTGNFGTGYIGGNYFYRDSSSGYTRINTGIHSGGSIRVNFDSYLGVGYASNNTTVHITGYAQSNGIRLTSDIRKKTDFQDVYDEFNDFIYSLPIGTYLWKDQTTDKRSIGVNANYVDKMLPKEYTQYLLEVDEAGYYSANYMSLIPMLVKVVQSQNSRLINLEYEIMQLKGAV